MSELIFPLTLAYNMEDKKIGCALMQPAFGASFTGGQVSRYFDSDVWELSPKKIKLYIVKTQEEFDLIVKITNKKP